MDTTDIVILLVAAIIIALPFVRSYGRKVQSREIQAKLSPSGFRLTQGVVGVDRMSGLSFDESHGKVCLVARTDRGIRQRVVDFNDILSSEIFEDGASITRTVRSSQIAGAIIGGLVMGGVGTIIGGLSGKKETKSKPERIDLRLLVNDTTNPVHDVAFMRNSKGDSASKYRLALQAARHWHGIIEVLIKRADEADKKAQSPPIASFQSQASFVDELKKLVELRDSGALTAEEFQQQKNRLLSASH